MKSLMQRLLQSNNLLFFLKNFQKSVDNYTGVWYYYYRKRDKQKQKRR